MSNIEESGCTEATNQARDEKCARKYQLIGSGPKHDGGGTRTSLHGTIYQLNLLMLFLKRGLEQGYTFSLATEVDAADKFDDLVFRYEKDGAKYRFLQAKHRQDISKQITVGDLINQNGGDFSVQKYFISYLNIKNAKRKFFKGEYQDFIICTNLDIDDNLESNLNVVQIMDPLLNFENISSSKRLKLKKGTALYEQLMDTLQKNPDYRLIAKKLGAMMANNAITIEPIFTNNRDWIMHNILDVLTERVVVNKHYFKLREDFLLKPVDPEMYSFHKIFLSSYIEAKEDILRKGEHSLDSEINVSEEDVKESLSKMEFPIPKSFIKNKSKHNTVSLFQSEIETFLDKLIFAVNQPSEDELKDIVQEEIGDYMDLVDSELVANKLQTCMLDWAKKRHGSFITRQDCLDFFSDVKNQLASWGQAGLAQAHKTSIEKYGCSFQQDHFMKKIGTFLQDECKTFENIVFLVFYDNLLLTEIKLMQLKSNARLDEFMYSDISSLVDQVFSKVCPIKAFSSRASNELFIVFKDHSDLNLRANNLLKNFIEVANKRSNKKIFLIIPHQLKNDFKNFFRDLFNKTEQFEAGNVEDHFENLSVDVQAKLLEETQVIFRGCVVKLGDIFDENMKNIEGDVLSQIIRRELVLSIDEGKDSYEKIKKYCLDRVLHCDACWETKPETGKHSLKYGYDDFILSTRLERKIVIIAASPGMGKSTLLSHKAAQIRSERNDVCVLRINLSDYCKEYGFISKEKMTINEAIQFLYKITKLGISSTEQPIFIVQDDMKIVSRLNSNTDLMTSLQVALFTYLYNQGKFIVFLDGCDEIAPHYKEEVFNLLATLQCCNVEKMWVTTRPYGIETDLERIFKTKCYYLECLQRYEKVYLLTKYYEMILSKNIDCELIENFFGLSQVDYISEFNLETKQYLMETPHHVIMMAMIYETQFIQFYNESVGIIKTSTDKVVYENSYELFKTFFTMKFQHLYKEIDLCDPKYKDDFESKLKDSTHLHEKLALMELFEDIPIELISEEEKHLLLKTVTSGAEKTGLVERVQDGKPRFSHRSFAEFFAAGFLAVALCKQPLHTKFCAARDLLYNSLTSSDPPFGVSYFFNFYIASYSDDAVIFKEAMCSNWDKLHKYEYSSTRDCLGRTIAHIIFFDAKAVDVEEMHRNVLIKYDPVWNALTCKDDLFKWTPLHYNIVFHYCNLTPFKFLNENFPKVADVSLEDIYGRTPLLIAVRRGCSLHCLRLLATKMPLQVNHQDALGKTALHYVLERFINPHIRDEFPGEVLVCWLLHLGADIEIKDNDSVSPRDLFNLRQVDPLTLNFLRPLFKNNKNKETKIFFQEILSEDWPPYYKFWLGRFVRNCSPFNISASVGRTYGSFFKSSESKATNSYCFWRKNRNLYTFNGSDLKTVPENLKTVRLCSNDDCCNRSVKFFANFKGG